MNQFLLIAAVLALYGGVVLAKELPNEVDLRAAYCIPVINNDLQEMNYDFSGMDAEIVNMAAKKKSEIENDLNRLKSYLLPRLKYLDNLSLGVARERGKADVDRFNHDKKVCVYDVCQAQKSTTAKSECAIKCLDGNQVRERLKRCNDLSFLPF